MRHLILAMLAVFSISASAQQQRWQQRAEYKMDVQMNVESNQYTGTQKLVYYNNSNDTLTRVFYHLYYNAFQPGSMMDVRSRTIEDPDSRVRDRIANLKEDEIGYLKVKSLKQNGKAIKYKEVETILEVTLDKPIMPKSKVTFDMEFEGQVPLQIRRAGRDSEEGVRYSMSQWYPKMAEYDYQGWHANPYIGREFHGIWGDFDVKITIDSAYTVGGTGYLQNPQEIGHGYQKQGTAVKRPKGDKLIWHFKAPNVHDFMWAAHHDYTHTQLKVEGGPNLHFLYIRNDKTAENWAQLPEYTARAFQYMNKRFGKYPWDQFSTIQGGDGGMEYPMSTLITGNRSLRSLVGVTVHELVHSWYQGALATNEALYAWIDEGFTSYATAEVMNHLFSGEDNPRTQMGNVYGYLALARSGKEEPLTTHADHFNTNFAYGRAAYSKGATFLVQLSYIMGQDNFDKAMRRYFNTWKFKHPNDNDFIRVMEKTSGMELDWYREYFVQTTKQIDYGVKAVMGRGNETFVTLEKIGDMPMPLDVLITYTDGSKEILYIPLVIMRGGKANEYGNDVKWTPKAAWPWVNPTYTLKLTQAADKIESINIDPSGKMADVNRTNNEFTPADYMQEGYNK